jgi:hypothetical protein
MKKVEGKLGENTARKASLCCLRVRVKRQAKFDKEVICQ